jgi:hypothetical protein
MTLLARHHFDHAHSILWVAAVMFFGLSDMNEMIETN